MFCPRNQPHSQVIFVLQVIVLGGLLLQALPPATSQAQVTTAISSDGSLGSQVTPNGNIHDITGGTRPGEGPNLFHSFEQFSIGAGDTANFLNETGAPTDNILSRVTGGNPSNIFGTIQTTGFPEANLFLMNPAGVLFGPTASLDVGGSFQVTTADYLRLTDNVQFTAVPGPSDAVLSVAPVAAFGFLNENSAGITYDGTFDDSSSLAVREGETVSFVGGDIRISGDLSSSFEFDNTGIKAPGGQVNLVSVASSGEVVFDSSGLVSEFNVDTFAQLGEILLTEGALIDVIDNIDRGGTVIIRSGRLELVESAVFADTRELDGAPIGIDISVRGDILVNDSILSTDSFGQGNAGDIRIKADSLHLIGTPNDDPGFPSTKIGSVGFASGETGNIEVMINNDLLMEGRAEITTTATDGNAGDIEVSAVNVSISGTSNQEATGGIGANTRGSRDAGRIQLMATNLTMTNRANIQSSTFPNTKGNGGTVTLDLAGNLVVENGSVILGDSDGTGRAADLDITAKEISITGIRDATDPTDRLNGMFTGIDSSAGEGGGQGGNVNIAAENLQVTDQGIIKTSTEGSGEGGKINIEVLEQLSFSEGASITAETTSTGNAGNISLTGDQLTVMSGGRIEASTSGQGAGGTINIMTTDDTTVSGVSSDGQTRSGIFAKTQSSGGGTGGGSGSGSGGGSSGDGGSGGGGSSGDGAATVQPGAAGDIEITAKNFLLNGGAQIDSSTTSGGAGGSVTISATDAITVEGASSRITSDASRGNGRGGSISLDAGEVAVRDGGSVTAKTGGTGDAGAIDLDVREALSLLTGGTISTSTSGAGKGGVINAQADSILLDGTGSSITADTLPPFADLTILLSLLHEPDSDLTVQLDSPSGTRLALFSQVGGNGQNFTDTMLSDAADQPITAGSAPFTGTFRPREPLAQLIGEPLNGTWTLNVQDRAANNGTPGSLQNWVLQTQASPLTFSPTDLPKNVVDNGSIQSSLLVNSEPDVVVQGTGEASGAGGDIVLNARSVAIQNGATLSVNNTGSGQGGSIEVQAGNIDLNNGATISAASSGAGDAGSINLRADDTILVDNSTVTTIAEQADGGNIKLTASDIIQLTDSQITSSVGGGASTVGGNISLDPEFIILQNSQILAEAFEGQGGNISLVATNAVLVDPFSRVDASSALGVSGSVDIQAPIQNLSGTIAPLPEDTAPVTALYNARCAAGQGGHFSTFVDSKTDSLSPTPGAFLASPLLQPSAQPMADNSVNKKSPVILTASVAPLVLGHAGELTTACP